MTFWSPGCYSTIFNGKKPLKIKAELDNLT